MERSHSITSSFTKRASSPFFRALGGRRPTYSRELGEAWSGDSRQLLRRIPDESVDLIFTSPPYALVRSKEYGNEPEHKYVRWFRPFAKQFHRVLKPEGSLVLNIGGSWKPWITCPFSLSVSIAIGSMRSFFEPERSTDLLPCPRILLVQSGQAPWSHTVGER